MNNFKEKIIKSLDSEVYVHHLGSNQSWTGTPVKVIELGTAQRFVSKAIDSLIDEIDGELEETYHDVIEDIAPKGNKDRGVVLVMGAKMIKETKNLLQSYKEGK